MSSSIKHLRLILPLILALVFALQGCASKPTASKPADIVLPADLAKAFEVKDLPPAVVKPRDQAEEAIKTVADTQAAPKKKTKKGEVKKGEVKKTESKTSSFVIPNRRPKNDPIWVGERIWMDVTWLATKAGEFLLEVLPFKEINDRKVYHIKGTARTSDLFSLVYKAEDSVDSYIDFEGWFPYKFSLHGEESKHLRNSVELFDHAEKKQYVYQYDYRMPENEVHEDKGFKDLTPFSQDGLSALYYARTFDLQNLKEGANVHFPVTTNGNPFETHLIVVGREEVNTKMGYMKAIKTKVETRFNGVLQQAGDAFIWFSDNEKRYPVKFEAKVKIGWVSGVIKRIVPGTKPTEEELTSKKVPAGASGAEPRQDLAKVSATDGNSADQEKKRGPKPKLWFHNLIQSSQEFIAPNAAAKEPAAKKGD